MDTPDAKRRLFVSIVIVVALMGTGFAAVSTNGSAAETTNTLTIGFGEYLTSANPFVGIYDTDYFFFTLVYDYLTSFTGDGAPTPNLASTWWYMSGSVAASTGSSFSGLLHPNPADWPAGSIWEYNLTQNVFWSDGEVFTADDVKYTIDIQTGPNYINYWAYQPYTRWIDHCEKINDYKVRIFFADHSTHTPTSVVWADSMLIPIMPMHLFSSYPDTYIAQSWTGVPAIGTGPFKGTANLMNEIIAKESVTLVKNSYYDFTEGSIRKGLGGVFGRTNMIDSLVMKFYAEEMALIIDLKTEKLDASKISASNYLALNEDPNKPEGLTLTAAYSSTSYSKISHFNVGSGASGSLNPARMDPALLRASAIATNKSYICDVIFKGLATPGVGMLSPVLPQYYWSPPHSSSSTFEVMDENGSEVFSYTKPLDEVMGFDLTLANQILDAAGYVWSGTPGASVRKIGQFAANRLVGMGIIGDASSALNRELDFEDIVEQGIFEDMEISEYLATEWAHIGIKITPKPVNLGTWMQLVYGFQYTFCESYWSGDPDPNYLMYIPTSYARDGWNEFGTANATYDYYYDMQASSFGYAERKYWLDECQKWQYLAGGAMIYTCYPMTCYAFNDASMGSGKWTNWGNWSTHPFMAFDANLPENPLWSTLRTSSASVAGIITGSIEPTDIIDPGDLTCWLIGTDSTAATSFDLNDGFGFAITGVAPGEYNLLIMLDGRIVASAWNITLGQSGSLALGKLDLSLDALMGAVCGQVITGDGTDIADLAILMEAAGSRNWSYNATIGSDGKFEMDSLMPGSYELCVMKGNLSLNETSVVVFAGTTINVGVIDLSPEPAMTAGIDVAVLLVGLIMVIASALGIALMLRTPGGGNAGKGGNKND